MVSSLVILLIKICFYNSTWAASPGLEQIIAANVGAAWGHLKLDQSGHCELNVYAPDKFPHKDSNYWLETRWMYELEGASYPNAEASKGHHWLDLSEGSKAIVYYFDTRRCHLKPPYGCWTERHRRYFGFDPISLRILHITDYDERGMEYQMCAIDKYFR